MSHRVVVGSASVLKLAAVREAFRRACIESDVASLAAPSGVAMQPVGRVEMLRGARNRASAAVTAGCVAIGIENGIVREDGRWFDLAAVVLVGPDGMEIVEWSEVVAIPDGFVTRAEAVGFERVTVGAIIAEMLGSSPDDPHATLSCGRRTRTAILTDAIVVALGKMLVGHKGDNLMESTHRIEIGGVVRELPIREVAPGVRVALFNILGDWLLAEAAGKALSAKLPRGVTSLVMPDGKATALLHVLGRMTGLPTFVARKEKKPYMAEPVRKAAYRSITTDHSQALYLGADDAVLLAGSRVVIVDDVVSTGGTIDAMRTLMAAVGADVVGIAAIFTEGGERPDVISLGNLPLF